MRLYVQNWFWLWMKLLKSFEYSPSDTMVQEIHIWGIRWQKLLLNFSIICGHYAALLTTRAVCAKPHLAESASFFLAAFSCNLQQALGENSSNSTNYCSQKLNNKIALH